MSPHFPLLLFIFFENIAHLFPFNPGIDVPFALLVTLFIFDKLHSASTNGDEVSKAKLVAKVQKFIEWPLKFIGFHSRSLGNKDSVNNNSSVETHLQLSAYKAFIDLVGNQLCGKWQASAKSYWLL